jgi:hypothetical protein
MSTDMDAKLKEHKNNSKDIKNNPYYEQSSFVMRKKSVTDSLLIGLF